MKAEQAFGTWHTHMPMCHRCVHVRTRTNNSCSSAVEAARCRPAHRQREKLHCTTLLPSDAFAERLARLLRRRLASLAPTAPETRSERRSSPATPSRCRAVRCVSLSAFFDLSPCLSVPRNCSLWPRSIDNTAGTSDESNTSCVFVPIRAVGVAANLASMVNTGGNTSRARRRATRTTHNGAYAVGRCQKKEALRGL